MLENKFRFSEARTRLDMTRVLIDSCTMYGYSEEILDFVNRDTACNRTIVLDLRNLAAIGPG